MKKVQSINQLGRIFLILCLLTINFVPFISQQYICESGAPGGNGVTNTTWYIENNDDINRQDETLRTKDIVINSSGKMTWLNVSAYIDGDVEVKANSFFNLSNCFLNLSGDFSINGIVNFDNVTLLMNSSYDGEFGINVATTGTFNVLNKSNITAYNITAPIDIYTNITGIESWGLHYNFTVHGKLTINDSYISYTYGDLNYLGGIHLYSTSDATISNSIILKNKISAIYAEGDTSHQIKNNYIFNSTKYGIYLIDQADAIIDNNTINTQLDNFGYGIYCEDHCHPTIQKNVIKNNHHDGIYLRDYCNATIRNNTIENNQGVGIYVHGRVTSVVPPNAFATVCYPRILGNIIRGNEKFGIYDLCCPAEIDYNVISHTKSGTGLLIKSYQPFSTYIVHFNCWGNITNNTILYNDNHGVHLKSSWTQPYIVIMDVKNNTVTNNNWSGLSVLGGLDSSNNQYSPLPDTGYNNFSFNNHYGIENAFVNKYPIWKNIIGWNNQSGIFCKNSSKPDIYNNKIKWNLENGIESRASTPKIFDNWIPFNNHSGIYSRGGDSNFQICTNEIYNNSWSGIECNNSNCRIQNNNITNNTRNGIKLSRGSPTINQNNILEYNKRNGLACYKNAQPTIFNNIFSFNTQSGIFLNNSAPKIGAKENIVYNNYNHGILSKGGSGGKIFADISSNLKAGIYTANSGTDTVFIDCNISGNGEHGVNATKNSAPEIINSTIHEDNSGYAFWSTGSADPVSINTTFNHSSTFFDDGASVLTVKWFVQIRTIAKSSGDPVGDAKVWINSTTQTGANPLWTGITDFNGRANWLKIIDYTENKAGVSLYSPADIKGDAYYHRTTHVTPNPVIDYSQSITIELLPNNPPTNVANIKPTSTHNSHPTIKWVPATDPDEDHLVRYKVMIGNLQNTSSGGYDSSLLINTSYMLSKNLVHDKNDGNRTYHITIISKDGHGGDTYTFQKLYLLNHKPSKPDIDLDVPKNPTVLLKAVTCEILNQSIDPDGDQINYTYRWYKNSKLLSELTNEDTTSTTDTISVYSDGIEFEKGDEWEIRVLVNDGIGFTNEVFQTASFTIGNVGPTLNQKIDNIIMNEDEKKLGFIDLKKAFKDIDEENGLKYVITVTEKNLEVKENKNTHKVDIIPALNWNGEAEINFTCIDSEGLWAAQIVKVTVKPVNDKPEFKSIGGMLWRPGTTISFTDDAAAIEEELFQIYIISSDADIEYGEDDKLHYQVSRLDKITIIPWESDPLNATLTFTPTNDDVGKFVFTISIKDDDSKDYLHLTTIEIMVMNTNDKPYFVSIKKETGDEEYKFPQDNVLDLKDEIKLKQGDVLSLIIIAADPDMDHDNDVLTFHTTPIEFIELISNTDDGNTVKLIITPGEDDIGEASFNITVKDVWLESDSVRIILYVENVPDQPRAWIDKPSMYNKEYYQNEEIIFEGDAEDPDLTYGDKLTFTWSSDVDGELGTGKKIKKSNLTIGKHIITFTVEDSDKLSFKNSTSIIILEPVELPSEEGKDEEGSDVLVYSIAAMLIIILIMLIILFLVLRAHRRGEKLFGKKEDEIKSETPSRLGDQKGPGMEDLKGTEATVVKLPTQYEPPSQGIPESIPTETTVQPQQQPPAPITTPQPAPPQLTTCPRCNAFMTFAPDGTMFCINCGFKPEKF